MSKINCGGLTYKEADIDIDVGSELVQRIAKIAPQIGGFGGLIPFCDHTSPYALNLELENIYTHMAAKEETPAAILLAEDKYRWFNPQEEESTVWRLGGPPTYDAVNKLFEEDRTKEWPKGSLEETVQNAIKTWEMELSHKVRLKDFKTISLEKFRLIVNGRQGLSGEETLRLGSYNALLKNSLPEEYQYYKAEEETFESSHEVFRSAFPRGFAWEVVSVYSGPPVIAVKFRHWGYFEGPYKGHAPTGQRVQFYGLGVLKVDESLKVEDVEIYYDPSELFGGLLAGPVVPGTQSENNTSSVTPPHGCPFAK